VKYTKENGVIAIDVNASPIHLAIAEVAKTGELVSYQTISLHHLIGLSQNSKDHQEWILAHQIVDLAIQKNKAIAVENLKKLRKGKRGVGMLKYAPQLNIDKDIAGAYVIGRRALGFKEEETNQYKRNALESELRIVENARMLLTNLIQSLQSEPSFCEGAYGRNPERGRGNPASSVAWQVLKVAFLFPILGKVLPRDLFPLKPLLVEGVWDRVRSRLVPLEAGGTVPIRDF
jgi:hypothetical protein